MRLGKRITYMLLTAALVIVSALTPMETKAGQSKILMDAESLVTADWNNPEGDVEVKDGTLVFPKDSSKYTRFIAKTPAKIDEMSDTLVTLSATIKMEKMAKGESFILGFGMRSIEAKPGDAENIEVAFTNDGGIKASITVYDEEEKADTIMSPKSCGMSIGSAADVTVSITTDSRIKLTVNNREVGSGKLPVNGEGRVGFLQTGGCSGVVSNVELVHYEYDRPENTNIVEDFEKGGMDVSKLTAKMLWTAVSAPMGQMVEEYKGSQVLMHRNTGAAYIGTTYTYSNFVMTFDVPYFNLEDQYNKDGKLELSKFNKLIVTLGGERSDWDSLRWDLSGEAIVLEPGTIYSNSNRESYSAILSKNPFEEGKPFSIQVKMVDSVVTVGMKWLNEEKFQTVLQYKLKGGTPTGYIHIWAPQAATFAIDNLEITNLDDTPNLVETEYISGKIEKPAGNAPEPLERVYAEVITEKTGPSWYLLIPTTAVVSAGALIITALATRGKKKEKEEAKDE